MTSLSQQALEKIGLATGDLFEAFLKQTPDHVYFKDTESRFIVVSQSLCEHFGLKDEGELVGKNDADFFSEEHARQAYEDEQEALRTGKTVYRKAEKETWPSGRVTYVSTKKHPILLDGSPVGVLGISRDVTRETLAIDALERHDRLLKEQNDIMRADLSNARNVQSLLIPGRMRPCRFLKAGVMYDTPHVVSGDVISFPRPEDPEYRFFLGDVCGHGVSAGIYTILVKYLADRFSQLAGTDASAVLVAMNKALSDVLPNRFVTAVNGVFTGMGDGGVRLHVSHGASPKFVVQRKGKEPEIVQLPAAPGIGLLDKSSYENSEFEFTPGDRIVLCTDGLLEALNESGEEYGLERLSDQVSTSTEVPVEKLPQHLMDHVRAYMGVMPVTDDQSCLAFEVPASA